MKRGICLLLVLVLALGAAGCSRISVETYPTTETTQPTEETTAPTTEPEDTTTHIKMNFVGDCLLASNISEYYANNFRVCAKTKDKGYFLSDVSPLFRKDDFTIVNLENVLSDQDLGPIDKGTEEAFWFKGPAENVEILTGSSVEVVSLENNHVLDYGYAGQMDTRDTVEKAGLEWGDKTRTVYLEKEGFVIAVICHGLWYSGQERDIIQRIEEADGKSDYQVVFFHGGQEGVHEPEYWKVNGCHAMVDAGADLILGGHPHVLQPEEIYNGVHIVYSLGNFCYGGSSWVENRTIIYSVDLTVEDGKVLAEETEIIPCYVHTGTPYNNFKPRVIIKEDERQKVLDFMAGKVDKPD